MTAYERSEFAAHGIEVGKALEAVDRAATVLFLRPRDGEYEDSIAYRSYELLRAIRQAERKVKSLHYAMQQEDPRPVIHRKLGRTP